MKQIKTVVVFVAITAISAVTLFGGFGLLVYGNEAGVRAIMALTGWGEGLANMALVSLLLGGIIGTFIAAVVLGIQDDLKGKRVLDRLSVSS